VLRTVTFSSGSATPTDAGLYSSRTIEWQLNDGTSSSVVFQTHLDYPVGVGTSLPSSVATGDFNGDGVADLVTANTNNSSVSVLLGSGNGRFAAAANFFVGGLNPPSVAVGDVNGDGRLDIVTANQSSSDVSVLLGQGDGTFGAGKTFAAGANPDFV